MTGSENKVEEDKKPPTRYPDYIIILNMCGLQICFGFVYAVIAPFLPIEAIKKDISASEFGIILGSYPLIQMILNPVSAMIIPKIGVKRSICNGMLVVAATTITFSFIDMMIPSGTPFFLVALSLRVIAAIGASLTNIALLTLTTTYFSAKSTFVFSWLESTYLVGMVAGPAIGGLLFDLGGLMLPFLFVGLLILLFIASACFIMPSDVSSDAGIPSSQSSLKTIRLLFYDIRIIMVMVCVFVNIFAIGYIDVTLTNDLLQFNLSSKAVGGIFLIAASIQILMNQVWSLALRRWDGHETEFLLIGFLLSMATFVISGPMYPIPIHPSLALVIVRQILHGLSNGPLLLAAFSRGNRILGENEGQDTIASKSAFSACLQSFISLGMASGPLFGGWVQDTIGYKQGSTIMFTMNTAMIIPLIIDVCKRKKDTSNYSSMDA